MFWRSHLTCRQSITRWIAFTSGRFKKLLQFWRHGGGHWLPHDSAEKSDLILEMLEVMLQILILCREVNNSE
jgi:hypothetical protein